MELSVGKYVRFDNVICQIEEVKEDRLCFDIGFYDHWNELTYSMKYKEFVEEHKPKFSDNIIDLIEVGDYVNGYKVCEVIDKGQKSYNGEIVKEKCFCLGNNYNFKLYDNEIETIVTKEMYESISYKVGD